MSSQKTNPVPQWSTIGFSLIHPPGLNRQDVIKWVKPHEGV